MVRAHGGKRAELTAGPADRRLLHMPFCLPDAAYSQTSSFRCRRPGGKWSPSRGDREGSRFQLPTFTAQPSVVQRPEGCGSLTLCLQHQYKNGQTVNLGHCVPLARVPAFGGTGAVLGGIHPIVRLCFFLVTESDYGHV